MMSPGTPRFLSRKDFMSSKRTDYLPWDAAFLAVATIFMGRSKDPNTRNGACIVSPDYKKIAVGYNGFPRGCSDDEFPWGAEGEHSWETKYDYAEHAERNAIDNTTFETEGSTMWIFSERGYFPCPSCARGILQHGIKNVVLAFIGKQGSKKYSFDNTEGTRRMFRAAGVRVRVLDDKAILYLRMVNKLLVESVDMIENRRCSKEELKHIEEMMDIDKKWLHVIK